MQWEEEVHIIQEEMQRTIVYYEWKQQWWLKQNPGPTTNEDTIQHEISAYSQKQAHYCECMAKGFAVAWLLFLQSEGICHNFSHVLYFSLTLSFVFPSIALLWLISFSCDIIFWLIFVYYILFNAAHL